KDNRIATDLVVPDAAEEPAPKPESRSRTNSDAEEMTRLFVKQLLSYGQIGIQFKKSPGAVEQAIRRQVDGSPLAARKAFAAQA
ncbi:MAG: hypothetical protein IIC73_08990, partial [Armatimonadetes bacterium]|nr:hypothetical protein [Armatimonadota bacterium]